MTNQTTDKQKRLVYLKAQKHFHNVCALLRDKIKRGDKLRVCFTVIFNCAFPAKPLFELMLTDPLFAPFIVIIPDVARGQQHMAETYRDAYEELHTQFPNYVHHSYNEENNSFVDFSNNADLIYFANPYSDMTLPIYAVEHVLSRNILPFHINYAFFGVVKYNRCIMALPAYNFFWRVFTESTIQDHIYKEYQPLQAINTVVTGYCKMDALAAQPVEKRSRKKIIIAPHHTIGKNGAALQISTFLKFYDLYLRLPKLYPEIDFVFRPHPLLLNSLKNDTVWGEIKTRKYMEALISNINVSYDKSGCYFHLFTNSDGIIHDCGSFLPEYLYTGKPALYLLDKIETIEDTFDTLGKLCLKNYYIATTEEDIFEYINTVVIKGNDTLQEKRQAFANKHLKVNYPYASQAILDYIKETLCK